MVPPGLQEAAAPRLASFDRLLAAPTSAGSQEVKAQITVFELWPERLSEARAQRRPPHSARGLRCLGGMDTGSPGGSAADGTPSSSPNVHGDAIEVMPAPKASVEERSGRRRALGAATIICRAPPPLPRTQVRAFPIVGGNPGPR